MNLPDLQPLAETARRALGCDAVVVTVAGEQVATDGWEQYDSADAWGAVLAADAAYEGRVYGSIRALQCTEAPFDNADLIDAFAMQVALAAALTELKSRSGPPQPEVDHLALDRFALPVTRMRDLSDALHDVLSPLFGGAQTGLMVADPHRNTIQLVPGAFGGSDEGAASHRLTRFDVRSNSARVHATGLPYLTNACAEDTSLLPDFVRFFGQERVLSIPLRDVGVLHLANPDHDFDLGDLARLDAIAPQIASMVELAVHLLDQRRLQRIAVTLAEVALAVASGEPITSVLPPTLDSLAEITDANLLALVPDDGEPIVAHRERRRPDLEQAVLDEAEGGPGMRAYVVASQGAGDPGWAAFYQPIQVSGARVGTLAALRTRGEPFSRAERDAFARLVNTTALAYANDRYNRQRAEVARLAERQRIADDLHDDVAQILFAAQMSLDEVLAEPDLDDGVAAAVARARGLVIRGDATIRRAINQLSSPPAADVGSRLASTIATVESEFAIQAALDTSPAALRAARSLSEASVNAIVKVVRESLVNAAKHARPCEVRVSLAVAGHNRVQVAIADTGPGIKSDDDSRHGMASMRAAVEERGGTFEVSSRPGDGARVEATFPVPPAVAAEVAEAQLCLTGDRPGAAPLSAASM